jgi:hypothetical protein
MIRVGEKGGRSPDKLIEKEKGEGTRRPKQKSKRKEKGLV